MDGAQIPGTRPTSSYVTEFLLTGTRCVETWLKSRVTAAGSSVERVKVRIAKRVGQLSCAGQDVTLIKEWASCAGNRSVRTAGATAPVGCLTE